MSRHWLALKQESLEEAKDVADVLANLAQKNPALANQLAGINWGELRTYVIKQSLQDTAAHFNLKLETTFNTSGNYHTFASNRQPNGTTAGVIQSSNQQLGVVQDKGIFHFVWTAFGHYESDEMSGDISAWKSYFEERRRVRTLEAMAKIIGQDVESTTNEQGTTTITFTVDEVLS